MTRASVLRDQFDREFAAAPRPPETGHADFLCIRIAGERAAISIADIASLHADLVIVALPTRAPELLGVAAIRSAIVPIYDLRFALGVSGTGATRWSVLVPGGTAGFAFEVYDGHARIHQRAIAAAGQRGHVRGQFVLDGHPRSIVDLQSALKAFETPRRRDGDAKEP
jgi:chemotaxis signal transduction protein